MSFDLTTHHRDKKTGKVSRTTLYSMECHKDLRFFRRGGKCYDEAGVEIPDPKLKGEPGGSFTRSATVAQALGGTQSGKLDSK